MPDHKTISSSLVLACVALTGCGPEPRQEPVPRLEARSPSARPEIVEALRQDQQAPRHPADGAGRVRLVQQPELVTVSQPGSWLFEYEAGPLGIAQDGWLFFQAPPFWGWSTPQTVAVDGLGFTQVTTAASGVELHPATIDQQLLAMQIRGRELRPGETIQLRYGAGPAGALADRYAESRSCFFFAVDGDGDGVRSLVESTPCVEVGPGPAAHLLLTLPSSALPGQPTRLSVALLDAGGNRASDWVGEVLLSGPAAADLPASVSLVAEDEGATSVELTWNGQGVLRVEARTESGLTGVSNPMWVDGAAVRVLWADLHGHSGLSDGTGTPRDYFRYARDVAGLDVVALTDHDHWGMRPLAIHPEVWEEIRRETELFHRSGEFVTLLGYEWTNWIHGHRHVLYFSDHGEIFSSLEPEFESPQQLWEALRGRPALTFAHHSAGGPVATNWQIAPDPELEPVTEIVSVHGSSEAMDSPAVIYSPVAGNFVRDVLDRGYPLGFIGSGDGHDGHPGQAHWNAAAVGWRQSSART